MSLGSNKEEAKTLLLVALVFAFGDESISMAIVWWYYASTVSTILNVDLSPLLILLWLGL